MCCLQHHSIILSLQWLLFAYLHFKNTETFCFVLFCFVVLFCLSPLINLSIKIVIFPDILKIVKVTPPHKKECKHTIH